MHTIHRGLARAAWAGLALAVGACASSEAPERARTEGASEEAALAQLAAVVLDEATRGADHAIPASLLDRARGIIVVPNVTKAALGIGGRWGRGLAVQRLEDGTWSAPAFVSLGGASYGFQIGAQSTDLVLVLTGDRGLEALVDDHVKLGADMSIAAGPLGRNVEVGTNLTMDSAIYSYSRSEGLFAGVSLDGAVLELDEERNRTAYGDDVTARHLLAGGVQPAPELETFARMVEAVDVT
jgi:lipid-binding SYLF domain-containing protein